MIDFDEKLNKINEHINDLESGIHTMRHTIRKQKQKYQEVIKNTWDLNRTVNTQRYTLEEFENILEENNRLKQKQESLREHLSVIKQAAQALSKEYD